MPLPTYDLLIDPLLRILATKSEPARVGEIRDELAAQLGISPHRSPHELDEGPSPC